MFCNLCNILVSVKSRTQKNTILLEDLFILGYDATSPDERLPRDAASHLSYTTPWKLWLIWFEVLVCLSINFALYTSRRKHFEGIWQETSEFTCVRRPHWCAFHLSHIHVSNKGMYVSVPEVRRGRRTGSSAVNFHGCSRQKVQISAGVCWGRESLSHHRQHCQPCVKRNLAGRQPNNPTRGHIFCYGSRSAAFCKPEFRSKATEFLDVVVCIIALPCPY